MAPPVAGAPLRFGRFELLRNERRLLADGQPVDVGGRAFDLLLALVDRPQQLVGKRELIDLVWPGLVVEENNLAAQVSALRKLLGGDIILTVPGRGYRFVAPIETAAPAPAFASAPDGAPGARLRTNLPVELRALLGRDNDLAELGACVDAHRFVTVVGPGGIGKSLLTQHLLHARRDRYAQGVCWVELTGADPTALPGVVASALGVHGGTGAPLQALVGAVASLQMLIALDNAEQLIGSVSDLCRALHDAAPGLRLVVTSQVPLRLPAERVFRVDALSVPSATAAAAEARQFGAVALFVERAQALDRRFTLTETNATAVIEICRTLDGLPLAIEFAAARAPTLGLTRLLDSMRDRLHVLTAGRDRAAPERQRTLRGALEWSFALLEAREQTVFRRLGVVEGSASLELIGRMLARDPETSGTDDAGAFDRWDLLDALDVLVDRSLLVIVSSGDGALPRYRLLESPRAYALERLEEAGERVALQRRHALAVAAIFAAAYDDYFSGAIGADAWMRQRAADLDNARAALAWARNSGDVTTEMTIAATLLRALPPSLYGERMALAEACEARVSDALPALLQVRALMELSNAFGNSHKLRSHHLAERALALARDLHRAGGDRFTLYHALCLAVDARARAGVADHGSAMLAELQALEDPDWPAQRLIWGAEAAQFFAHAHGDQAMALASARRLVELDRRRGKDASIGLGNLVAVEVAAGDVEAAVRSGTALVASLQGTRHEFTLALARLNLCGALLAGGDAERAREVAQALWPQAVFFDWPHYAADYLALLAALENRPRAAAQLLGYADAVYSARAERRTASKDAISVERVRTIALASLEGEEFERLHADGARLGKADVAALAFEEKT